MNSGRVREWMIHLVDRINTTPMITHAIIFFCKHLQS